MVQKKRNSFKTEEESFGLKVQLFRGFADRSRLAVLECLRAGPLSVGEIVKAAGLSQSNTSNHLACLRECGLVKAEQIGRFVRYRISGPRVERALGVVEDLLDEVAPLIQACPNYKTPETARKFGSRPGSKSPGRA